MLWFESLLFYGFEENIALQKNDGDIGLLPAIVEKVILSKLKGSKHHSVTHTQKDWLRLTAQVSADCSKSIEIMFVVCSYVSVGGAGVGPTVHQSNSQTGELHSQTLERLPHCAAWGQSIHTGTALVFRLPAYPCCTSTC